MIDWILTNMFKLSTLCILVAFTISVVRSLLKVDNLMKMIADIHSSESKTRASWVRWVSSFVIVCAIVLAFYQISKTGEAQEMLIISMITIAVGGKVTQKVIEKKEK